RDTGHCRVCALVHHSGVMYSGVMSEIYYRLHHEGTPCFCADHAWSAVWGAEFVAPDGSQYRCTGCVREPGRDDTPCPDCYGHGWPDCTQCDGTGHAECSRCDGTGIADSDRGYRDRKSTRLNSSHVKISYAVF